MEDGPKKEMPVWGTALWKSSWEFEGAIKIGHIDDHLWLFTFPITSWEIEGETMETVTDFWGRGAPKSLQMVSTA